MSVAWIMKCDSNSSQSPWSQTSDSSNFPCSIREQVRYVTKWRGFLAGALRRCSRRGTADTLWMRKHQDWSNSHAGEHSSYCRIDLLAHRQHSCIWKLLHAASLKGNKQYSSSEPRRSPSHLTPSGAKTGPSVQEQLVRAAHGDRQSKRRFVIQYKVMNYATVSLWFPHSCITSYENLAAIAQQHMAPMCFNTLEMQRRNKE